MPGQASASIPLSALSPPLDQSLEHFIRRLAIVDLVTAPALQHRGHSDGHLPEPIRQLLLHQPQQSPTIVSFLGSPSGEGLNDPPELVQPPAPATTGAEHGDRAAASGGRGWGLDELWGVVESLPTRRPEE